MKEIPLCLPDITAAEEDAVLEVLRSNWLTHGPKNNEFETMFAKYIGVKRALSLNSCTSALFLTILALGIKGEVILPSFTFVATANAVLAAGAKPVFADINISAVSFYIYFSAVFQDDFAFFNRSQKILWLVLPSAVKNR